MTSDCSASATRVSFTVNRFITTIIPLSLQNGGGGHLIPFAPPPCLQVGATAPRLRCLWKEMPSFLNQLRQPWAPGLENGVMTRAETAPCSALSGTWCKYYVIGADNDERRYRFSRTSTVDSLFIFLTSVYCLIRLSVFRCVFGSVTPCCHLAYANINNVNCWNSRKHALTTMIRCRIKDLYWYEKQKSVTS